MAHKFIVNTNDINEYGYRVLTEGIDYEQYMKNPVVLFQHDRFDKENKGSEVIGKCIALYVEDNTLFAEFEFDKEDEFANKIAGKVERGYIRMCSMYADIKATSTEAADLLPGQQLETVTKCKLIEISIVDIGGNNAALKLSRNGDPVQLQKIQQQNTETMSFKTIALALGLVSDAGEDAILNAITKVKLDKSTAETSLNELKKTVEADQTADATLLVEKAIKLNLIPEALKAAQLSAFKSDHSGQKVVLSKLIDEQEIKADKSNKVKLVKDVLGNSKVITNQEADGYQKGDFVKLSKEDPNELMRRKREDPEDFKALFKAEYGIEPNL